MKAAVVALLVLLALASSVAARDCTKVSNATTCASNGFTEDPYQLTPVRFRRVVVVLLPC